MVDKKVVWSDYFVAFCIVAAAAGLLTQSEAVSQGIQNGLKICVGVLIPALFPFMALSGFLSLTGAARIISIPLTPVTTKLFKLDKELGAIVLLSFIGGYPVGAKSISLLLAQKKINRHTAERMLCFCVNSGPSFLVTAVGAGMLFNKTAGIILLLTQTAATLLIGAAVSAREKATKTGIARNEMRGAEAFVAAVSIASSAILTMCSFAVLFSGILSLVYASGLLTGVARFANVRSDIANVIISGFFEVTAGCVKAAGLSGTQSFAYTSAIVSFGGLSVLFQIMSCFRDTPVNFRPMFLSRICHMFLSTVMAVPLYRFLCETQTVFASSSRPVIHTDIRTVFISVILLCMCAAMTLSGPERQYCLLWKNRLKYLYGRCGNDA